MLNLDENKKLLKSWPWCLQPGVFSAFEDEEPDWTPVVGLMLSCQKKEWLENLIKGLWGSLLKLQIIRSLCKLLPACRRLLFPLLHAEKGRPFSACNKGNRRRLRAGNVNCSLTTLFKFFFTDVICYTLWRTKHLSLITLSAGKILRGNSHTTEKWVLIGLSKKKENASRGPYSNTQ